MIKKPKKEKFHTDYTDEDIMLNVYTVPLFNFHLAVTYAELDHNGETCTWNSANTCLIILNKSLNKNELFRTIPHECLHVLQSIEESVGTKFDDETSAYMLGHLTQFVFTEFTEI